MKLFKVHYFYNGDKYEALVLEDDIISATNHILSTTNQIEPNDIVLLEEVSKEKGILADKEL